MGEALPAPGSTPAASRRPTRCIGLIGNECTRWTGRSYHERGLPSEAAVPSAASKLEVLRERRPEGDVTTVPAKASTLHRAAWQKIMDDRRPDVRRAS